jgi:carbon-monoxide dehydrogenase small subunit
MSARLTINRETPLVCVAPPRTLLEVLREDLHLTGAKPGCNQGVCGACTVLCDGEPIRACLALAADMTERAIVTLEGASNDAVLRRVQKAFVDSGAVQCGYCTPGMVLAATGLLHEDPRPGREEIREALSGNLCRCSGYVKIVDAVLLAAARGPGDGAP